MMIKFAQGWSATLMLAMILLPSCTKGGKGKNGREKPATAVRVESAEPREMPRRIDIVSVLTGRKQAEVYSRVEGKISFIGKSEGEEVKAGETLFRVDRSSPGESFLATPVVSPISGWVGRWWINSIGAQVSAQQPVVTIVDDVALRASVHLPTNDWLLVSSNTPVEVTVGREIRKASVIQIARAAEAASGRGTVTIEIDNKDHRWKAGMVASVAFDLEAKPRIVLPAGAVSITDQGSYVFVVEEDKAKRTKIQFEVIDNDTVEITEGLPASALVITEGVSQVGDNLPVKIIEAETKS